MSMNLNTSESKEQEPTIEIDDIQAEETQNESEDEQEDNKEEPDKSNDEEEKSISMILHLGDVILIKDPASDILNNHTFIIDYIDENMIKMIEYQRIQ